MEAKGIANRKIAKLTRRPLEDKKLFIDFFNPDPKLVEDVKRLGITAKMVDEIKPDGSVKPTKVYEEFLPSKIYIKNFELIPEDVIDNVAKAWYYGCQIGISTPNGWKVFENKEPKLRFDVKMVPLTIDNIPKKLYNKSFMEKYTAADGKVYGRKVTFAQFCERSRNIAKYIPDEAWQMIDQYNNRIFDYLKSYNSHIDYDRMNAFKKDVFKALRPTQVGVMLDFANYVEATKEIEFDHDMQDVAPAAILTEEQRAFLFENARYYGVCIDGLYIAETTEYRDGERAATYTERVYAPMSEAQWNATAFDPRRKTRANRRVVVREYANYAEEAKAYQVLMWLMEHNELMPEYERCPVCGHIFRKEVGVCDECGYQDEDAIIEISFDDIAAQREMRNIRRRDGFDSFAEDIEE